MFDMHNSLCFGCFAVGYLVNECCSLIVLQHIQQTYISTYSQDLQLDGHVYVLIREKSVAVFVFLRFLPARFFTCNTTDRLV